MKSTSLSRWLPLAAALGACLASFSAPAQEPVSISTPDAPTVNLPYGATDVLKLTKAKISEDVIIAYVKSTGINYHLKADEIVYLHQQGVSENVLNLMVSQRPQPVQQAAPATDPAQAAQMARISAPQAQAVYANPQVVYAEAPAVSTVDVIPYQPSYYSFYASYPWPYYWYYPYYWGGSYCGYGYYPYHGYGYGCGNGGYYNHGHPYPHNNGASTVVRVGGGGAYGTATYRGGHYGGTAPVYRSGGAPAARGGVTTVSRVSSGGGGGYRGGSMGFSGGGGGGGGRAHR